MGEDSKAITPGLKTPLHIFDGLGLINDALHTYSSAYRDDYHSNSPLSNMWVGRTAKYEISEIVCQKYDVVSLCRVNEIHGRFQ